MQEQQKHFATQDGTELFYRYRPAADGSADKPSCCSTAATNIPAG